MIDKIAREWCGLRHMTDACLCDLIASALSVFRTEAAKVARDYGESQSYYVAEARLYGDEIAKQIEAL